MQDFLRKTAINLSDLPGAPGFEDAVRDAVRDELLQLNPKLSLLTAMKLARQPETCLSAGTLAIDKMNNMSYALPQNEGGRLRVLLDAHLDEVAFMVRGITENALLQMQPLGGWSALNIGAHTLPALRARRKWGFAGPRCSPSAWRQISRSSSRAALPMTASAPPASGRRPSARGPCCVISMPA